MAASESNAPIWMSNVCVVSFQHLHKTGKIVLKGIVSQINQRCFGKPTT